MRFLVTLCLILCPAFAVAQEPMSGAEFEALTEGKIFHFRQNGNVYGGESYLTNRRVRWSFFDGTCLVGRWFERDAYICFDYGADQPLQCWTFTQTDQGFQAEFYPKSEGDGLYDAYRVNEPLDCTGPKVGV